MNKRAFRPTIARTQNSMKIFNTTKTNATIRDLEEEEGELEEKEGVVVSIKRDLINGAGWTVKDNEGQTYICSCASSMYEVPETVERGGILYPTDTVEVVFTVNPVLRINTIKEIKSLGEETEKIDISQWTHGDEATTVIAKPKSALSISDGFIKLDYNNDNKIIADPETVRTEGSETAINTDKLSINSDEINIGETPLDKLIKQYALNTSNEYTTYTFDIPASYTPDEEEQGFFSIDRANNITQVNIYGAMEGYGVIGEIKDQKSIPIKELSQRLITDGDIVDIITIDENGVIRIEPLDFQNDFDLTYPRNIQSLTQWMTPQTEVRNYIKVTVKENCNYCDEWGHNTSEFINYCPTCGNWNCLSDTYTSKIKCSRCSTEYCENCGKRISDGNNRLEKYKDNFIIGYGTTCKHCKTQLQPGTSKIYVNYCPDCKKWNCLIQTEYYENNDIINVFTCTSCGEQFCCTCGISQTSYGLTLTDNKAQYTAYKEALRKLKYIKG